MKKLLAFYSEPVSDYWRMVLLIVMCGIVLLVQIDTLVSVSSLPQFLVQACYTAVFVLLLGLSVYSFRLRPKKVYRPVAMPKDEADWPEVAVLIASDSESTSQLEVCLIAATQLDYPRHKLKLYLADSSTSVAQRYQGDASACVDANYRFRSLSHLCQRLDISLIDCDNPHSESAKLLLSLNHCQSPYVLVVEPTQIVGQKAIQLLLPHLLDKQSLALVQSASQQAHQDNVARKLQWLSAGVQGSIHTQGGGWVSQQLGGSTALLRREAFVGAERKSLDPGKHVLDVVEPVAVKTVQANENPSAHLYGKSSVINQLFGRKSLPLERPNIVNVRWQNLVEAAPCYMWLALLLPSLMLLSGTTPLATSHSDSLALVLLLGLCSSLIWRFQRSSLTELLNHLVNSLTIIISGSNRFVALGKNGVTKSQALHQRLGQSLTLALALSLLGLFVGFYRLPAMAHPIVFSAVLLVQFAVIAILLAAIATVQPTSQRRLWPRHSMNMKARCEVAGRRYFCEVVNMSVGGMAIDLDTVAARYAKKGAEVRVYGFSDPNFRNYSFQCNVASQRIGKVMSLGLIVMCGTDMEYANMVKFIYGDTSRWKAPSTDNPIKSEIKAMALLVKHGLNHCYLQLFSLTRLLPAQTRKKAS